MNIILATGGTGGHIFPAITLAKALKAQKHNCTLFTDKKTDKDADVESYILPLCRPSNNKFKFFLLLTYSCVLALYQIRKLKSKLVIGFGSYASFPTLLAAKILSIPIILHEQNIILGRVNRFFFKSAKLIAASFPETKYAKSSKCIFIGNFVDIKAQNYSNTEEILNILIIAGSQGASFFDDVVSDVICNLPAEMKKKIRVTQQCTKKNINKVEDLYKSEKVNSELSEFFDDRGNRLVSAHLVISRAGATSIAEITLAKRPAIYIPYPYSKDNHQLYNAKYIEDSGAAMIVEQNSEAKKNLTELLVDLLQNYQKLCGMANNTKKTRIKNGLSEFIKVIAQIMGF
ncbi:UDP-N-acetylglucosamine--N-acetylmuramyl-(pentapeptide) pyrophosphoryl-undecaprenol N-acetylglucosamine transferase [Wolbachia endosymbiont of Atemnus politus]|uniref:UDP-N-acetylglucosamine--N-acetylmuramyl- (pentapeptide) pyrophosphoryl-undecaprenol N-acetylglucosamine transferase n=1 Tax=Wolbachia endosymbiont of Atemnus politus TaxID=2682840 RepID=UPI0015719197|nr:UDP-N-acetylglucosamine--N-acetylmuramyl-(pentapeptide) pyrophosphoryl-undecaprenol N-acetylglucosamine transferase [Wolbachia endosymbiont of Atemnus politus]NSM56980.1 UDP-N-acetylglucosamine--N-acetylmuramyl-(pentapeptide) pyrophosphoryl-undecaprenol N-acetylglucosamine transferase [Wolbachia endosymbiont of Atemnus politus]NSX83680.1 UDP-N-acetylglucosamine--N-acetylmuramyl-(pentapeptide) pyrophosphoryl-undecaprenol N-acetylglucosamine transferase [Wolbachia endosymbiont of Atemnus politus